jgi:hypothetical protein
MRGYIVGPLRRSLPWLVMIGVFLGVVVALRLQGRLWTCSCGYVLFWASNINSADNSQHLFDAYTFTHLIHGFLFVGIVHLLWPYLTEIWQFTVALSAEMVWEAIENTTFVIERYRSATVSIGYVGDTILNSVGDILACVLGIIIARRLGLWRTIILALLIELVLLVTVRDNLILNILMLFYPVEAIRVWQAGH